MIKVEKVAVKFKLGVKCRDVITGFEGIVTSRNQHITGCDQYHLQPPTDMTAKEVKYTPGEFFDENRLEYVDEGISKKFDPTVIAKQAKAENKPMPINGGPNRDTAAISHNRR